MSKTLRQFQCRDDLWTRIEAVAKKKGITPDDVIQAALLQLFKGGAKKREETTPPPPTRASTAAAAAAAAAPTPKPAPAPASPPPPGAGASAAATGTRPIPKGLPRPNAAPPPSASSSQAPKPAIPRPATSTAPRLPPPASAARPAQPQQARPLYLAFEGNWYVVDKEEFVIGRGAKYSDLPIKDANISRRHCAIVRRGGDYFIKDLGSTNGIEFGGERVDNHKILEGSVYYLCEHEVRFSFTAPA
jgi:hypothetical protein